MTSVGTVISYPIPLYQNLPIEAQFYQPSRFVISAITLGITTVVTTSVDHNYVIGQECRLIIPSSFGCIQLNEKKGFVLSIPAANQVELNIYSLGGDAYTSSTATTVAQILGIGDVNTGQVNANGPLNTIPYVPGSFINISPL
jgi:hypothetical protein